MKKTKGEKTEKMATKVVETKEIELTEAEKFFIQTKINDGMPLEDVVKAVGKGNDLVYAFVGTMKKPKSLFEKNIKGKTEHGQRVVTVGTEAASQVADELRKVQSKPGMKYQNCITKIRD